MDTALRRTVLLFAAAVAVSGTCHAAEIIGIRHWSAPDHTRIVLDLSAPVEVTHSVWEPTRNRPVRIVLDLPGSTFGRGASAFDVGDEFIQRVRINKLRGPKAQVVLDLISRCDYKFFTLPAYGEKRDRIVVDVFRRAQPIEVADPDVLAQPDTDRVPVIVIDPGHGGDDPGAIAKGLKEKDICLNVALELKKQLEQDGRVKVVLTRSGDYYVRLRKRYRIAEAKKADLLVSIHANAARSRSAKGAEVFFVTHGPATDKDAEALAKLENDADLVGGVAPEDIDALQFSIAAMTKEKFHHRSQLLAGSVLEALKRNDFASRRRGVRQARFMVLQSSQTPSVLVEVGFLSNPADRKVIQQRGYGRRCASALRDGVLDYLNTPGVKNGLN